MKDYNLFPNTEMQDDDEEMLTEEEYYKKYEEELAEVDWKKIEWEVKTNMELDPDFPPEERVFIGRYYIGTVFNVMPSGKYYMPWTTNQTDKDVVMDTAYMAALEDAAEKQGLYVDSGEGDPCDLFLVKTWSSAFDDDDFQAEAKKQGYELSEEGLIFSYMQDFLYESDVEDIILDTVSYEEYATPLNPAKEN